MLLALAAFLAAVWVLALALKLTSAVIHVLLLLAALALGAHIMKRPARLLD